MLKLLAEEKKMQLNGKLYRLSHWCKYFVNQAKGAIAFLHTLSLDIIFVPMAVGYEIVNATSKTRMEKNGKILTALINARMLVEDTSKEINELAIVKDSLVNNIPLEMMYLLITDFCNLRCKYCFEESVNTSKVLPSPTAMNKNTARKAIELFGKLTSKYGKKDTKKVIHIYGGEPLLNPEIVYFTVNEVTRLKKKEVIPQQCEVVVVTNGTLLNKELARFFAKNNVTVGVSIDGPKNLNDIHRITKDSAGVFKRVKFGYNLLKEYGVKTGISATLTPEVVENFSEVVDFFINDLGIEDGMSFNILYFTPAIQTNADYFEKAAKCLISAFERFRKVGIYEERMVRKAKAFINHELMLSDCGIIGNQIVVSPDGRVGVCHDFVKSRQYFEGSVFEGGYDPIASGLFEGWKRRSPLFMKQCLNCEAIGICGGGCPASAEIQTGSRWNIDTRICPHSKLTLEWLIWDAYSLKN